jgi:hypothetical protein
MKSFNKILVVVAVFCLMLLPVIRPSSLFAADIVWPSNISDPLMVTGEDISNAIRTANAPALAKFFNSTIDLSIPGNDLTCSKAQAEQIIRDFFSKNPPKSFKINHQGSSRDRSQFFIGTYVTTKGKSYRTYFLVKKVAEALLIHQLQFDEE